MLNVALCHNASTNIYSDELTHESLILANTEQFNLIYDRSELICSVTGMALACEVLSVLNQTLSSSGKSKLKIRLGT